MPSSPRLPSSPAAARILLVGLPFLLGGCGPALIAGAVVLGLSLKSGSDDCEIPGTMVDVTIDGRVQYQKRPDGAGPSTLVPVRGSRVEVLRLNCGQEVIAATDTDEDGFYSLTVQTPSGSFLAVSALAQRVDPRSPAAVRNNIRERLIYSVESPDLTLTEAAHQSFRVDLNAPLDCAFQLAGAFHILEDTRLGFAALEGSFPPPERSLTVFWSLGDPEGTFFSVTQSDLDGDGRGGDPFVQLRGGALLAGCHNTDQFDSALILHEFGHYVAFLNSRDDSPGGPHSIAELLDPRVAWSEGWANFFSSMVRNDPTFVDTSEVLFRDGAPSCAHELCASGRFELETKETCSPSRCCQGIGSEDAVGALLWDLFDPPNEINDPAQLARDDLLEALGLLRSRRHFVYVGDFIEEVQQVLGDPVQRELVRRVAQREAMAGVDGVVFPFPDPFQTEARSGSRVQAFARGEVDGCGSLPCKRNVENFLESSDFFELEIPPGATTLSARLQVDPPFAGCSSDLELRIFNQEQTLQFTSLGQGSLQEIRFGLDSSFRPGSFFLVEVAGDRESPPGSGRGQKGGYELNVDVE